MTKTLIAAAAATLLAAAADAESHGHSATSVAFDDVQWEAPIVPGFQMALAWRNDDGREAWLFRMEPGTAVPMHSHTNDYWGTTIQGDWVHIHTDGTETVSGAGSYSLIEGGVAHADRCDGDVVCVGLLNYDGARDVIIGR